MSPRIDLPSSPARQGQTPSTGLAALACRCLLGLTLAWGAGAWLPAQAQAPQASVPAAQTDLQRTRLQAGMHLIDAQLALTPQQRSVGLMWRQQMPASEGMLFVFEQPAVQCFWMKNTLLPLTAAFVADDGTIINLVDMQPQSEANHCSAKPVRFVLEMHQGWFAKRGIQAGFKLGGAPFRPSQP
jgi:uncharacterized membrane protein (UPF0127 family)